LVERKYRYEMELKKFRLLHTSAETLKFTIRWERSPVNVTSGRQMTSNPHDLDESYYLNEERGLLPQSVTGLGGYILHDRRRHRALFSG
jgi:hypothetical protein